MIRGQASPGGACTQIEADLVLFYYGELSDSARGQLEEHIKGCTGCSRYLAELARLLPQTALTDEPPPEFWHHYSRELRDKLADAGARQPWWRRWFSMRRPMMIPALATAAVVVLVLSFTVDKSFWRRGEGPPEDAFLEVLPITENLDFYNNLQLLDNMELLEFMAESGNGA
jgi:hypothetical protein